MKNVNDAIGNRTRDLPGRRAVLQPTAPPRALITSKDSLHLSLKRIRLSAFIYKT
jgi:hypothetical protein